MENLSNFDLFAPYCLVIHKNNTAKYLNRKYLPLGIKTKGEAEQAFINNLKLTRRQAEKLRAMGTEQHGKCYVYFFEGDNHNPDRVPRNKLKKENYLKKQNEINAIVWGF
ncbi:hypothetical protein [Thalassomonas sp. M1454]|uniref:hypothetical protein n=1 Tax=Thalassomonas sp. M1454 TaxID=2594477 RepID=UPI00117D3803|nr:hypothetical protein [Thalassomonas sp. M1454]TRX52752.1 hypothetical protein FNN08_15435 [Thalassomonas sp. M1454]